MSAVLLRLAGSPRFQAWAARIPLLRRIGRAEGAAIFDLVQGFVRAQVLAALIEFDILAQLTSGPMQPADLAGRAGINADRMAILLQAGAGIGLLRKRRDGRFALRMRGAAVLAVPGLVGMIRHHRAFYDDLADPTALLRGGGQTQLSQVWPYVFGAGAAEDPDRAARYSALMADSQALVAAEVLAHVSLSETKRLLDVGGGTGAFLAAVGAKYPALDLHLFDLPAVLEGAGARLGPFGARVHLHAGSFRDDPLPQGADTISLIRVLYDHSDQTVAALLRAVHNALPQGGRLLVAEPMSGGAKPDPITDVYFSLYTLAMQTGRTRSMDEIAALLRAAGFTNIQKIPCFRPYIASAITATRG
jgi:demethylspheroidene O-methyltransferase